MVHGISSHPSTTLNLFLNHHKIGTMFEVHIANARCSCSGDQLKGEIARVQYAPELPSAR